MTGFRNYSDSCFQSRVEKTYHDMLINQTCSFVTEMKHRYNLFPGSVYNIWDTIEKLNNIVDESDPDSELPQIVHSYQTAISLKTKNMENYPIMDLFSNQEWSLLDNDKKAQYNCNILDFYNKIDDWGWLPIVGFIHDLGKVLLLKEYGNLEQWAVVGDTFPVGQDLDKSYVFENKNYHIHNESLTKDTYPENIGFEKLLMSWGHDEYLASILEKNNTNFPKEAIYIIRFHSFYSWHTPIGFARGYKNLANDFDWYMLPLLKYFQKSDLYSKSRDIPNTDEIIQEFKPLIEKYIPKSELKW